MNERLLKILDAYNQFKAEIMNDDDRKIKEILINENEDMVTINIKLVSGGSIFINIPLVEEWFVNLTQ